MLLKQEKKEERKSFSPQEKVYVENSDHDEDMMTDDFDSDSDASLNITCNVVYVLLREYDQVMEVEEPEGMAEMEIERHKPVCCYVMNNGYVEEQNAFFERPYESMKSHLKPLFIRGKVGNVGVIRSLLMVEWK